MSQLRVWVGNIGDPGRNPSFNARQQKEASMMLERESPRPVRALVLETRIDLGEEYGFYGHFGSITDQG